MLRTAIATASVLALATIAIDPEEPISSRILTTDAGERVLAQEVTIDAPVEAVWAAYTTDEGWASWASPVAEIDLRVGGTIRTHYLPDAEIGDEGTNTLHIVNYVPLELLTLRAELDQNWPDILKADADKLSNVILFDRLSDTRTRVRSFGIGYTDTPELDGLLQFFMRANEGLFEKLRQHLEPDDAE